MRDPGDRDAARRRPGGGRARRSGIVVDDYREMAEAIAEADRLEPLECRRYVEERFSPERMVRDYEAAYEKVVERVAV